MPKETRLAILQRKSSAFIVVNSMNSASRNINTMLPEFCPSSMSWRQSSRTEPVGNGTKMDSRTKACSGTSEQR